ncbi:MAG: histidine phosphatase family protein, partial [Nitrospirota bacterium]
TEGSEEKRYKGTIDVPLSERGIRQMEEASRYIVELSRNRSDSPLPRDNPPTSPLRAMAFSKGGQRGIIKGGMGGLFDAVYCSDLSRAVRGAEIIAKPFRLSPVKINGLRERDFGVWEGMSFDEIKEKYPEDFRAWVKNPLRFSPTGGENTLEVKERCMSAIDRIVSDHNGRDIAIVAHGGVNRIILCQFLGIPLENIFRIEQDYGAVNIVEFHSSYPVVKLFNYKPYDYV